MTRPALYQEAPPLTKNATIVLRRRYLARGSVESPRAGGQIEGIEGVDELFQRVARCVAAADARYGADPESTAGVFFGLMRSLAFLPNSPTLMNAGRPLGQLSACFVVPVPDSTEGIFEAIKVAALIQKTGGGTGFSFSRLRGAGEVVATTGGIASGPVSFMQVFDAATAAVKQGGTRRGANMGVLRIDHPDILEFITIKLDPTKMQNFNLSVGVTDGFMRALSDERSYDLRSPTDGSSRGTLDAACVWELICNAAWATGDPGLVFLDRMNQQHPAAHLGEIEATNPCGEQPLLPHESCNLGSINLARFVCEGALDWESLRWVIRDATHFLDNVIDVNVYPLAAIEDATYATRKLGLGVMGLADALSELDMVYGSEESLDLAGRIAAFVQHHSEAMSEELAARRGVFPAYPGSLWDRRERPMRNATTTTVAPTGTISIIAGCSSGIEPLFALAYRRNVLDGETLIEVHEGFKRRAEARGIWNDALERELAACGSAYKVSGVDRDLAEVFPTSHDLPPHTHVDMQAAFQAHVHAAVSKTINMPASAQPEDIGRAYRRAYELGCKGVTVYRDRSRDAQVLEFGALTAREADSGDVCPECGSDLIAHAKCAVCQSCGFSVCAV